MDAKSNVLYPEISTWYLSIGEENKKLVFFKYNFNCYKFLIIKLFFIVITNLYKFFAYDNYQELEEIIKNLDQKFQYFSCQFSLKLDIKRYLIDASSYLTIKCEMILFRILYKFNINIFLYFLCYYNYTTLKMCTFFTKTHIHVPNSPLFYPSVL